LCKNCGGGKAVGGEWRAEESSAMRRGGRSDMRRKRSGKNAENPHRKNRRQKARQTRTAQNLLQRPRQNSREKTKQKWQRQQKRKTQQKAAASGAAQAAAGVTAFLREKIRGIFSERQSPLFFGAAGAGAASGRSVKPARMASKWQARTQSPQRMHSAELMSRVTSTCILQACSQAMQWVHLFVSTCIL